jgi:flagellar basal body-associated protein FliL
MPETKEISTTDARQGSRRKDNLRVLIMSTVLILIVAGFVYAVYGSLSSG